MYVSTLKQSHAFWQTFHFMTHHLMLVVLSMVAILGIGFALHSGVSDQGFARIPEQVSAPAHPAGALTIFDASDYASEYPARTQAIYDRLATLRDDIGAERAYVFVYASRDLPLGTRMIANVFEVVRDGLTPQHQRLQGLAIPIPQLMDALRFQTYAMLPFMYGDELHDANQTATGYFGVDSIGNFYQHAENIRQTMREIEVALSLPGAL